MPPLRPANLRQRLASKRRTSSPDLAGRTTCAAYDEPMIDLWLSVPSTPPAITDAAAVDLWGSAVPAWVGALGSIAASVVAAVALILQAKTRSGLSQVTAARPDGPLAHLEPQGRGDTGAEPPRTGDRQFVDEIADDVHTSEGGAYGSAGEPIPFVVVTEPMLKRSGVRVQKVDRKHYELVNVLEHPIAVLEILQAEGGDDVRVRRDLPADLQPGEALQLLVERTLASPAVIALDVTYGTHEWSSRRRLYLD
jgi:hypothetical protein